MNVKRTATIIVVGAVLVAWLAGAATPKRDMPPPIVITPKPIDLRGIELTQEIARLHDRLRPTTVPTERRRNLFTFAGAAPRSDAAAVARSDAVAAAVANPASAPGEPALKLAGIAEDDGADGPERTAFISGEGQLFMVKQGDAVTARYRVTRISSDAVELSDVTAGLVRRLVMK
jgi:hypothetical protein